MIEVKAPACLPLGVTKMLRNGKTTKCLFGLAIMYPPIHLTAKENQSLGCSGPRANIAYDIAAKVIERAHLSKKSDIEIELAIPVGMGLFSETMLSLSTTYALAWTNNLVDKDTNVLTSMLDIGPIDTLGLAAFDHGGFLMVDIASRQPRDAVIERIEISHERKDAWALIMFLPKLPETSPPDLEARLQKTVVASTDDTDARCGTELSTNLIKALKTDDIALFGEMITDLQAHSFAAMRAVGGELFKTDYQHIFYEVMRSKGAIAWGQSLTGLALWALVKGETACIDAQKALQAHVGFYGGRILSAITDNAGVQIRQKD